MADSQCFHCGLPIPENEIYEATLDGAPRRFCCFGCQSVASAIYAAGLQDFYRRTPEGTLLGPPPEPPKDIEFYDLDEVQSEFVDELGDEREIRLLVEGIHCPACVWLIEKTLTPMAGVLEAKVNLTARQLHLRWDNNRIKLSQVMRRLADIGYAAAPFDPASAEQSLKAQNRDLLFRIAFAGFAAMNMMWVSIALYAGASEGEFRNLFHWVGFVLATPTLLYSGWIFFRGALTGLRHRHLTMDLPIAIGATTTWSYSTWVTVSGTRVGEVYFDTVVNFIFIILIGRYLAARYKQHALTATQRLIDLQPRMATVLRDGLEAAVPVRTVRVGETVLIRPGHRVPVDGIVIDGVSAIDEAMLSGESAPVGKKPGDHVAAGTVNTYGALTVRVTGTLKDTALGRIIRLVEEAQASKAPIQQLADRLVPWFVLITVTLATLTFFLWVGRDFENALLASASVLIITCPCALGMATPMSISVASGLGANRGILVKNGAALEMLSQVSHIVFDKTGTLTEGRMRVQQVLPRAGEDGNEVLRFAAGVEHCSEHMLARAIIEEALARGAIPDRQCTEDFENRPGWGVRARVDGHAVCVGTVAWLEHNGIASDEALVARTHGFEDQAMTCVHVGVDGRHEGAIVIADKLRDDAVALVERLRAEGVGMTLLSGDRRRVAEAVAARLGGMEVIAEVLPEDKDRIIREIQARGMKVAMVGDGVNDAPALIRADVGIALGSGTDVSMESADIVLIHNELMKVHQALLLSRRTLRTIRQNIGMSFAYNGIMVPLAMMGLVTPLVAAVTMPISSLAVIGNAARIGTLFSRDRKSPQARS